MKTSLLRTTTLVALLIASTSASFAGPGLQYWTARRDARRADTPAVTAPAVTKAKGDRMIVKQGKRTSLVTCTGATAQCQAHCGN
ncbi:MAG: hypothetical protein K0R17_415 [Rariglobus sp.]|jgi:hypothetical protein|nr:hypothetical protein [Rariglobus sp.]